MLWSDPQAMKGRAPSKRGVGCAFGPDVTENFLKTNNLSMVIRSHEMKEDGYEVEHGGQLITLFSAPNYCDQMGNKGAFIRWKCEENKEHGKGENLIEKAKNSIMGFTGLTQEKLLEAAKRQPKKLTFEVTNFKDVEHPKVKPMQYANPMLGAMMGM